MNTNFKTKKGLALVLAVAMMLALLPAMALADSTNGTLSLNVNQTQTIYEANKNNSGNGTINNISPGDSTIVSVSNSTSYATITGLKAGTTTVTVNWTDTNTSQLHTEYITVTVSGTSYNSGSTLTVAAGGSINTNNLGQVISATTANGAIATATNNNSYVTVNGVSAGSTILTVLYYTSGSASAQTITYTVNVTGTSYTGTGSTSPITQSHTLEAGKSAEIQGITVATNIVSSNPSVGTAALENGKLYLRGLTAGTTVITFTANNSNYSITLTVTGTASGSTSTGSSSGGVTFSKTSTSVSSGKNYRLKGMRVNGSSAVAADLRWMSTDTDVLTVNAKTGVFKGKTSGTAYLIAADPDTGAVGSIKVEIN